MFVEAADVRRAQSCITRAQQLAAAAERDDERRRHLLDMAATYRRAAET